MAFCSATRCAIAALCQLLVFVCLAAAGFSARAVDAASLQSSRVSYLASDDFAVPVDAEPWLGIALPHTAPRSDASANGAQSVAAWYRVEFDLPSGFEAEGAWALYLPYLYSGGRFFLNGQPFFAVPESDEKLRVKWERPHLLLLPQGSIFTHGLSAGRNVIHVRMSPQLTTLRLRFPVATISPAQVLQGVYEQRLFLIRTLAQVTSSACLATGLFVLFIWWRRRSEVLYGIFGLTAVLWGVRTLTFVIEQLPPDQWQLWRVMYQSATGGFVVCMALFVLRTAGAVWPKFERILVAYALVGPAVLLVGGATSDAWVSTVWTAGFFGVAALIVATVCLSASRAPTSTNLALMFSVGVSVFCAAHDYFLLVGSPWLTQLAPEWAAQRIFVLQFAANVVLLVMAGILASRFLNALADLELLNQTLDLRVAAREAVIEQNYQRLVMLEGQRKAHEERQRIMQDMHDGLGAQLFSSLSRVERDSLSQADMTDALRSCIVEMRLAIDSLSNSDEDFEAVYSNFRYRWEQQLKALGIDSTWQNQLDALALKIAPHQGLQILRIAQEALANVLKHARATHVWVSVSSDATGLCLEVADNGCGLSKVSASSGRGLANMQTRAARLGGSWALSESGGRTRVVFTMVL